MSQYHNLLANYLEVWSVSIQFLVQSVGYSLERLFPGAAASGFAGLVGILRDQLCDLHILTIALDVNNLVIGKTCTTPLGDHANRQVKGGQSI